MAYIFLDFLATKSEMVYTCFYLVERKQKKGYQLKHRAGYEVDAESCANVLINARTVVDGLIEDVLLGVDFLIN